MGGGSLNDERLKKSTFPALLVEDLKGETLVIATIADTEITDFGGGDVAVVLGYEEFEGKKHRLNATSRKRLQAAYGDDLGKMVSKEVVLEVVKAPNPKQGGAIGKSIWIADPDAAENEWPGRAAAAPRKVAPKRAAKKR